MRSLVALSVAIKTLTRLEQEVREEFKILRVRAARFSVQKASVLSDGHGDS